MSWSLVANDVEPAKLRDHLVAAKEAQLEASEADEWAEGVEEQMEKSFDAAEVLAAALDSPTVNASVSGHAPQSDRESGSIGATVYGVVRPQPGSAEE